MADFFTKAFEDLEDKESFYRTVFMHDPSAEAERLRLAYYKTQFKSMGDGVRIGAGVRIVNPQYISVGNGVTICDGATLIARGEGGIVLEDKVMIKERVLLDTESDEDGSIHISDHVYIGTGTTLFGHKGLEIGSHALLAQNITLTPYSHIFEDPKDWIIRQGGHSKKVTIGKDAYIGMGVCILYSGDIGDGAVVGSGAVVVKPIPPYTVAVGNPAKVIRKRSE